MSSPMDGNYSFKPLSFVRTSSASDVRAPKPPSSLFKTEASTGDSFQSFDVAGPGAQPTGAQNFNIRQLVRDAVINDPMGDSFSGTTLKFLKNPPDSFD